MLVHLTRVSPRGFLRAVDLGVVSFSEIEWFRDSHRPRVIDSKSSILADFSELFVCAEL